MTTPIEEVFGTREVIKNVNLILEESVDDILDIIDHEAKRTEDVLGKPDRFS